MTEAHNSRTPRENTWLKGDSKRADADKKKTAVVEMSALAVFRYAVFKQW